MTDNRDPYRTHVIENLFDTLRDYSQSRKTTDEDILRERARQYAEVPARRDTLNEADALTVLTVRLGDETYGLDVGAVTHVRPLPHVTRVPNTPPFLRGVVNVRGAVVTLLDLRAFMGLSSASMADEMVVISGARLTLAIAVGTVVGVVTVPRATVRGMDDSYYALGTTTHSGSPTVILDIDSILNDKRLLSTGDEPDE